ncbi:MAG TPA: HD domain-containing protein [Bacilli bacterium]|nr:HD domain-containing protein [Bacilli bacterium]
MNTDKWNKVFDDYVRNYDQTDKDIIYKYNHTYRVCKQSANICDNLHLNDEQKEVAYLIALLHDIGRFYQDKVYNTYIENGSFDHGDYGIKILFEDRLIRKFIKSDKYDKYIYLGVKNHNKYAIEKNLNEEELLQCKIVRDADKLDILNNAINVAKINKRENDYSDISDEVRKACFSHKMVNKKYRKTNNDSVITLLSLVYDLNFDYSFIYIKENNIINKIYENIKDKDKFKPYFDEINNYIEKRCYDVK